MYPDQEYESTLGISHATQDSESFGARQGTRYLQSHYGDTSAQGESDRSRLRQSLQRALQAGPESRREVGQSPRQLGPDPSLAHRALPQDHRAIERHPESPNHIAQSQYSIAHMDYRPGQHHKGFVDDFGQIHLWPTDQDGSPHHTEYMEDELGWDYDQADDLYDKAQPFVINPQGEVTHAWLPNGLSQSVIDALAPHGITHNPEADTYWRMGSTSIDSGLDLFIGNHLITSGDAARDDQSKDATDDSGYRVMASDANAHRDTPAHQAEQQEDTPRDNHTTQDSSTVKSAQWDFYDLTPETSGYKYVIVNGEFRAVPAIAEVDGGMPLKNFHADLLKPGESNHTHDIEYGAITPDWELESWNKTPEQAARQATEYFGRPVTPKRGYDFGEHVAAASRTLWVDDERPAPEHYTDHAWNVEQAKQLLANNQYDHVSLDHDLGTRFDPQRGTQWFDDSAEDGSQLADWMVQTGNVPPNIHIHSANPYGAVTMYQLLKPHAQQITMGSYEPYGGMPTHENEDVHHQWPPLLSKQAVDDSEYWPWPAPEVELAQPDPNCKWCYGFGEVGGYPCPKCMKGKTSPVTDLRDVYKVDDPKPKSMNRIPTQDLRTTGSVLQNGADMLSNPPRHSPSQARARRANKKATQQNGLNGESMWDKLDQVHTVEVGILSPSTQEAVLSQWPMHLASVRTMDGPGIDRSLASQTQDTELIEDRHASHPTTHETLRQYLQSLKDREPELEAGPVQISNDTPGALTQPALVTHTYSPHIGQDIHTNDALGITDTGHSDIQQPVYHKPSGKSNEGSPMDGKRVHRNRGKSTSNSLSINPSINKHASNQKSGGRPQGSQHNSQHNVVVQHDYPLDYEGEVYPRYPMLRSPDGTVHIGTMGSHHMHLKRALSGDNRELEMPMDVWPHGIYVSLEGYPDERRQQWFDQVGPETYDAVHQHFGLKTDPAPANEWYFGSLSDGTGWATPAGFPEYVPGQWGRFVKLRDGTEYRWHADGPEHYQVVKDIPRGQVTDLDYINPQGDYDSGDRIWDFTGSLIRNASAPVRVTESHGPQQVPQNGHGFTGQVPFVYGPTDVVIGPAGGYHSQIWDAIDGPNSQLGRRLQTHGWVDSKGMIEHTSYGPIPKPIKDTVEGYFGQKFTEPSHGWDFNSHSSAGPLSDTNWVPVYNKPDNDTWNDGKGIRFKDGREIYWPVDGDLAPHHGDVMHEHGINPDDVSHYLYTDWDDDGNLVWHGDEASANDWKFGSLRHSNFEIPTGKQYDEGFGPWEPWQPGDMGKGFHDPYTNRTILWKVGPSNQPGRNYMGPYHTSTGIEDFSHDMIPFWVSQEGHVDSRGYSDPRLQGVIDKHPFLKMNDGWDFGNHFGKVAFDDLEDPLGLLDNFDPQEMAEFEDRQEKAKQRHTLNWEPGYVGKGWLNSDGTLHTWNTEGDEIYGSGGSPHHDDFGYEPGSPWGVPLWIKEDGSVQGANYNQPEHEEDDSLNYFLNPKQEAQIKAADPRLHHEGEWYFGSHKYTSQSWTPGQNGKGIITPEGVIHTWNVDQGGAPHHMTKGLRHNWISPNTVPSQLKTFSLDPQGVASSWYPELEGIFQRDPNIWNFESHKEASQMMGPTGPLYSMVPDIPLDPDTGSPREEDWDYETYRHDQPVHAWEPGAYGKGIIYNGQPYVWKINGDKETGDEGAPHHFDVAEGITHQETNGYNGFDEESLVNPIFVGPDGHISPGSYHFDHHVDPRYLQVHPDLYTSHEPETWNFSKVGAEIKVPQGMGYSHDSDDLPFEPWEPGHEGKGIMHPDGTLYAWKVKPDSYGLQAPYHPHGIPGNAIWILPDGTIESTWTESPGNGDMVHGLDDIVHMYPQFKRQAPGTWDFSHFGALDEREMAVGKDCYFHPGTPAVFTMAGAPMCGTCYHQYLNNRAGITPSDNVQRYVPSDGGDWHFGSDIPIPEVVQLDPPVNPIGSHGTGDTPVIYSPKHNKLFLGSPDGYHADMTHPIIDEYFRNMRGSDDLGFGRTNGKYTQMYHMPPDAYEVSVHKALGTEPGPSWSFSKVATVPVTKLPYDRQVGNEPRRPVIWMQDSNQLFMGPRGSHHGGLFRQLDADPRHSDPYVNGHTIDLHDDGGVYFFGYFPEEQKQLIIESLAPHGATHERSGFSFSKVASDTPPLPPHSYDKMWKAVTVGGQHHIFPAWSEPGQGYGMTHDMYLHRNGLPVDENTQYWGWDPYMGKWNDYQRFEPEWKFTKAAQIEPYTTDKDPYEYAKRVFGWPQSFRAWEPGNEGKAIVDGNGHVVTWNIGDAMPDSPQGIHHGDVGNILRKNDYATYVIQRDGQVDTGYWPEHDKVLLAHHPEFKPQSGFWNFGKIVSLPEMDWIEAPNAWNDSIRTQGGQHPIVYNHELNKIHVGPLGSHHSAIYNHLDNQYDWDPDEMQEGFIWPEKKTYEFFDQDDNPRFPMDLAHHALQQQGYTQSNKWNFEIPNDPLPENQWWAKVAKIVPQWAGNVHEADPKEAGLYPILYYPDGRLLVGHEGLHHNQLADNFDGAYHGLVALDKNEYSPEFDKNTVSWFKGLTGRPDNHHEITQALSKHFNQKLKPDLDDMWNFSNTRTAHILGWTPGQHGKAAIWGSIDDPRLIEWDTDAEGNPHHADVMVKQNGIGNFTALEISPNGEVKTLFGDPKEAEVAAKFDPRLHPGYNEWNNAFAKTAAPQNDISICGYCGSHAMSEPKQVGGKWVQTCFNCNRTRMVNPNHPAINYFRNQYPAYPQELQQLNNRPMNVWGSLIEKAPTHYNPRTGLPCNCGWGLKRKKHRTASQNVRKIRNQNQKIFRQPEHEHFLDALERQASYTPQIEAMVPWIASRAKHGDIRSEYDPGRDIHELKWTADNPKDPNAYYQRIPWNTWAQWMEARQHPLRRGVNIMEHSPHHIDNISRQLERDVRAKQERQNWLRDWGQTGDIVHRFEPDEDNVDEDGNPLDDWRKPYYGWTVRQLRNATDAEAESDALGHCIGSDDQPYKHNIEQGNINAYSLRDREGYPKVTWHFNPDGDTLAHVQGASGSPKQDYRDLISDFHDMHGMSDNEIGEDELPGQADAQVQLPEPETVADYHSQHGVDPDYWDYAHEYADNGIDEDTEVNPGDPNWDQIHDDLKTESPQDRQHFYHTVLWNSHGMGPNGTSGVGGHAMGFNQAVNANAEHPYADPDDHTIRNEWQQALNRSFSPEGRFEAPEHSWRGQGDSPDGNWNTAWAKYNQPLFKENPNYDPQGAEHFRSIMEQTTDPNERALKQRQVDERSNPWIFSRKAALELNPWEPGFLGKGFEGPDGKIMHWRIDETPSGDQFMMNGPHHEEVLRDQYGDLDGPDVQERYINSRPFWIDKNGELEVQPFAAEKARSWGDYDPAEEARRITELVPGTRPVNHNMWSFGAWVDPNYDPLDEPEDVWEDRMERGLMDGLQNPPDHGTIRGLVQNGWTQGEYGKGIRLPNGQQFHWNTTQYGAPHHDDVARALGLREMTGEHTFDIQPSGEWVSTYNPGEWNFAL